MYFQFFPKLHANFLNDACENLSNCPKKFWNFVKIKNGQGSIPPSVNYGNASASDSLNKAEMFNNYFYKSFNTKTIPIPEVIHFVNDIKFLIFKMLRKIKCV